MKSDVNAYFVVENLIGSIWLRRFDEVDFYGPLWGIELVGGARFFGLGITCQRLEEDPRYTVLNLMFGLAGIEIWWRKRKSN